MILSELNSPEIIIFGCVFEECLQNRFPEIVYGGLQL